MHHADMKCTQQIKTHVSAFMAAEIVQFLVHASLHF